MGALAYVSYECSDSGNYHPLGTPSWDISPHWSRIISNSPGSFLIILFLIINNYTSSGMCVAVDVAPFAQGYDL